MAKRKTILTVLWVIIGAIAAASVAALILFPQWKGIFLAGMGGFLILNILLSMFFIKKNFKN
ncbi:MAG: hypothetical protein A2W86_09885 [Bacteroidetes bacterium GWD2_45_23]|nr:MAG: hypothetical protein A2W87_05640 [Bacteroidetes bacterium GWC2_46_850]OFX83733.1 MAG: hypothetical protein A2W86_09885 [Bacteroidetes bacterium GWD2_45_23]HAR37309.1 hypothetical protein [Porphyromonadaceae bacterium]HBB00957.1 hypothetical protein [Porphyromonadaceae bacterium]HCC18521.1 hypothetical protein [Porphyromonadaceae bacterium]